MSRLTKLIAIYQKYPIPQELLNNPSNNQLDKLSKIITNTFTTSSSDSNPQIKRLTKLISSFSFQSISSTDSASANIDPSNLTIQQLQNNRKNAEMELVSWQKDEEIEFCPFCLEAFATLKRRHHCRLCGKLVCGNDTCSELMPVTKG